MAWFIHEVVRFHSSFLDAWFCSAGTIGIAAGLRRRLAGHGLAQPTHGIDETNLFDGYRLSDGSMGPKIELLFAPPDKLVQQICPLAAIPYVPRFLPRPAIPVAPSNSSESDPPSSRVMPVSSPLTERAENGFGGGWITPGSRHSSGPFLTLSAVKNRMLFAIANSCGTDGAIPRAMSATILVPGNEPSVCQSSTLCYVTPSLQAKYSLPP